MNRQSAAVLAVACLTALAGCGFLTGSESLSFSASPALPTDDALSETGYEQESVDRQIVTRNFSAAVDILHTAEAVGFLALGVRH